MQAKIENLPMLLKPREVQRGLGIHEKTLRDLKDTIFKKGIHYFIPPGLKHPLWNRDALWEWVNGNEIDEASALVDEILNNK